jgi:type II secretory pathway component PulF
MLIQFVVETKKGNVYSGQYEYLSKQNLHSGLKHQGLSYAALTNEHSQSNRRSKCASSIFFGDNEP